MSDYTEREKEAARVLVRETDAKWFPKGHDYLPLARKIVAAVDAAEKKS